MISKNQTEEFIAKVIYKYGRRYDYSKVDYINAKTKICIICPLHGDFWQTPNSHLTGYGCLECSGRKQKTTDQFVNEANIVHNYQYDYSKVMYIRALSKVEIICPEHGSFFQTPNHHLSGDGCIQCGFKKTRNSITDTLDKFIVKATATHNNIFSYKNSIYINSNTKIEIICDLHGSFWQIPKAHIRGQGCPKCKTSFGEREIEKYLLANQIQYIHQYKILSCKDKRALPFDFAIFRSDNELHGLIEFHGEQHYKVKNCWGGIKEFKHIQNRDSIKRNFCKNNNIRLLEIPYKEYKRIEVLLKQFVDK